MPIFDDDSSEQFKSVSGFQFSGTRINDLAASEYTLFGLAVDCSGSVSGFVTELEGCMKTALEGCQKSPRVDNLLVRLLTFNSRIEEQHGFRPLADCAMAKYTGVVRPGGCTALYDCSTNLIDSLAAYGKQLTDQDYTANGIVVVVTDGQDVGSTLTSASVKAAIARAKSSESLESIVTILIGVNVNDPAVSGALQAFKVEGGFDQYVEANDANPKTLARVAGFISKSVSSQSQSIGSKAASQPITF